MSQLEQLKTMTTVVSDTGDIEAIRAFLPTDATTNPTLIYAAAQKSEYRWLIDKAIREVAPIVTSPELKQRLLMDHIFVNFGLEILKIVPGRVSTEVDAHLSFDTDASVASAQNLISLYEKAKVPRERILIKLASTWEGVRAAEILEMQGIHCNMTLMFSLEQAIACAEANATLVSPFVGRVLDWYKKNTNLQSYAPSDDPGVRVVRSIYHYFKKYGFRTQVMGASFRNKSQIMELAGCDLLTISPQLLEELETSDEPLERRLSLESAKNDPVPRMEVDEARFRYALNDDPMACDRLADGIRRFAQDWKKLADYIILPLQT